MSDWVDELTPDERQRWDAFVARFRRDELQKIAGSTAFVSLVPPGEIDVKFAVELGTAIMLDKPILAVVMPDAIVPGKLALVANEIVYADLDTEKGRALVAHVAERFVRAQK